MVVVVVLVPAKLDARVLLLLLLLRLALLLLALLPLVLLATLVVVVALLLLPVLPPLLPLLLLLLWRQRAWWHCLGQGAHLLAPTLTIAAGAPMGRTANALATKAAASMGQAAVSAHRT